MALRTRQNAPEPDEEHHALVQDVYEGEVRQADTDATSSVVRMDWETISGHDEQIAENLLDEPTRARKRIQKAIAAWDDVEMEAATVRVHNLPESQSYRVGKQRTDHLGSLIAIEGDIVDIDPVKPFAETAALECNECSTINSVGQAMGVKLIEPAECRGHECGSRSADYMFVRSESKIIDSRKIILERSDTNFEDDQAPRLKVYLTEDLVDRVGPGDHVELVGRYDTAIIQNKSFLTTYLDTWDIESHEEGTIADDVEPELLAEWITDEVSERQDEGQFGAEREVVVEVVCDRGVREKEVQDRIDDLVDEKNGGLNETPGGRLMLA